MLIYSLCRTSLQEEIDKLKKNQNRRLNRKKQMKPDADGNIKPLTSVSSFFAFSGPERAADAFSLISVVARTVVRRDT